MDYCTQQELDRFHSCCTPSGECLLWKNALDRDGYGGFYFRKKGRRAHRVAWYFANGPIPDGMVIDHMCRNRNCVNPKHLRCVTASVNAIENTKSVAALNRLKTTCKMGHPFDVIYTNKQTGKSQRICSICENEKGKRLRKKWLEEANRVKC